MISKVLFATDLWSEKRIGFGRYNIATYQFQEYDLYRSTAIQSIL